jgi:hypothetical protein
MKKLVSDNQKLILISGPYNGGKTLIFNLFKKENNYIYLDLSNFHYKDYENIMIDQIGEENVLRLKPLILNTKIFEQENFLREVGLLMKQYPKYNFIIKPSITKFDLLHTSRDKEWITLLKKYTSIRLMDDIHHFWIIRHPKMAWVTTSHKHMPFEDFLTSYSPHYKGKINLIKIEEVGNNKCLQKLLPNTDLTKILPYTPFDLMIKRSNNYDNLDKQFEKIEESLEHIFTYFNYDKYDKNVSLFMDDDLSNY